MTEPPRSTPPRTGLPRGTPPRTGLPRGTPPRGDGRAPKPDAIRTPSPGGTPLSSPRPSIRPAAIATAGAAAYGLLALLWALGIPGYPYGPADPAAPESLLGGVAPAQGAAVLATLGAVGALVGVPILRGNRHPALLVLAGALALVLLVVLPDRRLLMITAYLPLLIGFGIHSLLAGAPMPETGQSAWTLGHMLLTALLGLCWLTVTLRGVWPRLARSRLASPEAALRVGRWAVGVAVATPLVYAATRWTWALGIPLGISEEFHARGAESGLWLIGAMLASLGVGGAVLTLGLVQWWGERYPRLIWWRRGRRVPPMLAVVPATTVSIMVTAAGFAYWRLVFTLSEGSIEKTWATMGPELLWPLWGFALAVATGAYWLRRRTSE